MLCKIADVTVEVPEVGNMPDRCRAYCTEGTPDIVLDGSCMRPDTYPTLSAEDNYYLLTGFAFYRRLLEFDGLMLHASAVMADGRAYLFSGPCGMGKSTHAKLWLDAFGDRAVILNDDKPALRRLETGWRVYGTPWCGKDGINKNDSAELAGICFLHRGDTKIRRISPLEALPQILRQTGGRSSAELAQRFLPLLDRLLRETPLFDFYSHAAPEDALVTYQAMNDAKENVP